jgi:hypothetical protein
MTWGRPPRKSIEVRVERTLEQAREHEKDEVGRKRCAYGRVRAPAGLLRAGLGADVLGTGAQAWGSEGAEGVHVDYAL